MKEEINLKDLIKSLFTKKKPILLFSVLISLIAVTATFFQDKIYKAEAVLIPSQSGQLNMNSGTAALASSLGVGSSFNNEALVYIAYLESKDFLLWYIDKTNILIPLMARETWDEINEEWRIDEDIYSSESGEWKLSSMLDENNLPENNLKIEYLRDILSIDTSSDSIEISLELNDAMQATLWLDSFISLINVYIASKDKEIAEKKISFLQKQLPNFKNKSSQDAISSILREEFERLSMASSSLDYAFKVIDRPIKPVHTSNASKLFVLIFTFFTSVMLSSLYFLIREEWKDD